MTPFQGWPERGVGEPGALPRAVSFQPFGLGGSAHLERDLELVHGSEESPRIGNRGLKPTATLRDRYAVQARSREKE